MNPDVTRAADVRLTFGLEDGTTVVQDVAVPAASRSNVWINAVAALSTDPAVQRLGQSAMRTTVESRNGVPIVVERAMYWPIGAWMDGTVSEAVTDGGAERWAVADVEVGGARQTDTFLLVGNTASSPGTVSVTLFFADGTTAARDFAVAADGRLTVWVNQSFPEAADRKCAAVVESTSGALPIIVERATYGSDAEGRHWATGISARGTKLP